MHATDHPIISWSNVEKGTKKNGEEKLNENVITISVFVEFRN